MSRVPNTERAVWTANLVVQQLAINKRAELRFQQNTQGPILQSSGVALTSTVRSGIICCMISRISTIVYSIAESDCGVVLACGLLLWAIGWEIDD